MKWCVWTVFKNRAAKTAFGGFKASKTRPLITGLGLLLVQVKQSLQWKDANDGVFSYHRQSGGLEQDLQGILHGNIEQPYSHGPLDFLADDHVEIPDLGQPSDGSDDVSVLQVERDGLLLSPAGSEVSYEKKDQGSDQA